MGLGAVQRVGFEARKAFYEAYRLKRQGVDPRDARREKRGAGDHHSQVDVV
jgi:hypothetical protein